MSKLFKEIQGFTLIEVVITIIIMGILAAVALRSVGKMAEIAKVEETKNELENLEYAIVGNAQYYNDNTRLDFGYVGDVGAMPPNLDALFTNPGGYATWRGPYVAREFEQNPNDYKQDAWGVDYAYGGGTSITSSGSGSDIIRKFGESPADFLANGIDGVILDLDGTPPGSIYRDSISITLTVPNGSGGLNIVNAAADQSGFFSFNSIPIGSHNIRIVYFPNADTLQRFITVLPRSRPYEEYFLSENVWTDSTGS